MILNEYNTLLREHFDFSDRQTTKFLKYINESDQQNQLLTALAGALYEKIVDKCDKIDFGSIPRSRGDITKIDGYNNTVECINILRRLVVEYKEDPSIVDIELTALDNVRSLRPVFMKAFANNASFGMMYYNIITASIQHSVSFLISVAIQFVKDPDTKNINKALDKAAYKDAESNLLLESLAQFNKAFASGQVEKILRDSISGGVNESVEADEYIEDTIATTDDINKAIEDAPEAESTPLTDEDQLDEDVIFKIAAGDYEEENEVPEEEEEPSSPFSDEESSDKLAAGANNPDTQDDEVDPTPTMPINGCGLVPTQQSVEEVKGSIVKSPYHRHPSANVGYGETNEAIDFKKLGTNIKDTYGIVKNKLHNEGIKGFIKGLPGPKWIYIVGISLTSLLTLIKVIIPQLRNLVAFWWASVADLSESLAIQANLIELNAIELEANTNSNLSDEKKAKVVERQIKVAQKLRSLAEKFAIKDKKANTDAKKDLEKESRENKKTANDIKDQLPSDIIADSDLF